MPTLREENILKISIVVIVAGFILLYLFAQEIPDIAILSHLPAAEETVHLFGRVSRLSDQGNVAFLDIEGQRTETMPVIIFKKEPLFLREGDYVEVTGTLEEYQGHKEVVAHKVVVK